jgi:hypothetical protein
MICLNDIKSYNSKLNTFVNKCANLGNFQLINIPKTTGVVNDINEIETLSYGITKDSVSKLLP